MSCIGRAAKRSCLWFDEKSVPQIAAETGYEIPGVVEVIENYRDDYRKHNRKFDELVYLGYLAVEKSDAATALLLHDPSATTHERHRFFRSGQRERDRAQSLAAG